MTIRASADPAALDWDIEETGAAEFEPRRVNDRAWRLWIGLAVVAGIAALAVAGQFTGSEGVIERGVGAASTPTATVDPTVSILAPVDGATAVGAIVDVRGTSSAFHGDRIELAVVSGDALLGRTLLTPVRAGTWVASLPIFAPPIRTNVVLLAGPGQPDREPTPDARTLERRAFAQLHLAIAPAGPIGLWPPSVERERRSLRILVTGCAPLAIGQLTVRLVAGDGQTLASAQAPIVVDTTLSGAPGGYALGIGSFAARLSISGSSASDPLRVDVDWRDEGDGTAGTSTIAIPPAVDAGSR